jgi:hypothetical protein
VTDGRQARAQPTRSANATPRGQPTAKEPSDKFAERVSQDAFVPRLPEVTLPKSGGAIRGLGEKFSVESTTGTANLGVHVLRLLDLGLDVLIVVIGGLLGDQRSDDLPSDRIRSPAARLT